MFTKLYGAKEPTPPLFTIGSSQGYFSRYPRPSQGYFSRYPLVRLYQAPPKTPFHTAGGGEFAQGMQGYRKRTLHTRAVHGTVTLCLNNSERAQWYDPTDRKGEAQKIVML